MLQEIAEYMGVHVDVIEYAADAVCITEEEWEADRDDCVNRIHAFWEEESKYFQS